MPPARDMSGITQWLRRRAFKLCRLIYILAFQLIFDDMLRYIWRNYFQVFHYHFWGSHWRHTCSERRYTMLFISPMPLLFKHSPPCHYPMFHFYARRRTEAMPIQQASEEPLPAARRHARFRHHRSPIDFGANTLLIINYCYFEY